jgi:hypothetical protein
VADRFAAAVAARFAAGVAVLVDRVGRVVVCFAAVRAAGAAAAFLAVRFSAGLRFEGTMPPGS